MPKLSVQNLAVGYNNQKIIKDCSFSVAPGEILVILGASGDGKSTLLKALAGQLPRMNGRIVFDDKPVLDPTEKLVPGHALIKLVNQDFNLDLYHTVEENIRLRLLSFDEEYRSQRVNTLLRLTNLTTYRQQKAIDLSGGQQQRLAIARALADEPELVLLDEPFNQLDFQTKNKIATHVKGYLKKNNIGAIMVTHNGVEALEWADRILYMRNGKIVREDAPMTFYDKPQSLREARFFGTVNSLRIKEKKVHFRPSFFSTEKDKVHALEIPLKFKEKQHLGWYSAFTFTSNKQSVLLYSTSDISHLSKAYIRIIEIND